MAAAATAAAMAKSLRSKREKRLPTLHREIAEPFYDKKEAAKLAAQAAVLAAPPAGPSRAVALHPAGHDPSPRSASCQPRAPRGHRAHGRTGVVRTVHGTDGDSGGEDRTTGWSGSSVRRGDWRRRPPLQVRCPPPSQDAGTSRGASSASAMDVEMSDEGNNRSKTFLKPLGTISKKKVCSLKAILGDYVVILGRKRQRSFQVWLPAASPVSELPQAGVAEAELSPPPSKPVHEAPAPLQPPLVEASSSGRSAAGRSCEEEAVRKLHELAEVGGDEVELTEEEVLPSPKITFSRVRTTRGGRTQRPVKCSLSPLSPLKYGDKTIRWNRDYTTQLYKCCIEEMESSKMKKLSQHSYKIIAENLRIKGVPCNSNNVKERIEFSKKLYNFWKNQIEPVANRDDKWWAKVLRQRHEMLEYRVLKYKPPENLKLLEIMFGSHQDTIHDLYVEMEQKMSAYASALAAAKQNPTSKFLRASREARLELQAVLHIPVQAIIPKNCDASLQITNDTQRVISLGAVENQNLINAPSDARLTSGKMPHKVGSGPDYNDEYDDYDEYDETEYSNNHPVNMGKESLKKSSSTVPIHWTCSMCTFSNHESMVYCEMCGVFRETFVKSAKNGLLKDAAIAVSSEPRTPAASKTDSARTPVKIRALDSDGDSARKHASMSYDKANSMQLTSAGSSLGAGKKKKTPILSEEVLVERISLLASDGFQQKGNQSGGASSSSQNDNVIQKLSSDLGQLNVDKNNVSVTKPCLPQEYKPEKWMLADLESGVLSQLNLAIVGHVDSGKSTLSVRLLHLLGRMSKKDMHKNEKESKEKGKGSFAFAWAMDESSEERERGVTMTLAVAYLETKKFRVVLLDSPGHKDFVPNMISGATQADAAILVIDASTGSFEAGMDGEGGKGVGQTKEHAQLVRSFGVEQLVVAVNKMDVVAYAKERFDFIKLQLGSFLRSCNFKDSAITWIPLSAVENQNLVNAPSDARLTSWYQGFCLLDAIDYLQLPSRDVSKPLILPICDVIKPQSTGQWAAYGKLETGAIQNGSKVLVLPSGQEATENH